MGGWAYHVYDDISGDAVAGVDALVFFFNLWGRWVGGWVGELRR